METTLLQNIIIMSVFLGVTVVFSFLINYLFLKFSRNLGARNIKTDQVRWSANTKPAIGGFSFYIIFLLSISTLNLLPLESGLVFNKQLIGVTLASTLGFLLGLADDAYNTNPLVKFIGQLTCAFILISTDVYIYISSFEYLNFIITTLWVIGLMNSINMLDNMDGITASISGSIIIGIITFNCCLGYFFNSHNLLLVGVLGALVGFLFFNWNPSRIYMGDTGSQFLGVYLAGVSMLFLWNMRDVDGGEFQLKQFVLPMLVFIIPLIDTITVTIRRLLRKQSPFVGGRDHVTHHLAYLGLSDRMVATVLLLISLATVPILLLVSYQVIEWNMAFTIFAFIYFFGMFGLVQLFYQKGLKKKEAKS